MADILVVGSANVDYTLALPRLPAAGETIRADGFDEKIGGKGVNQAVAAARAGATVDMVACIGDDRPGRLIRDALLAEGIGVGGVSVADTRSGIAVVMTATGGDNVIAVVAGANARLAPASLTPDRFQGKRVVLCQLEVPVAATLRAAELARDAGAVFMLDPAPASTLPPELLSRAGWLTPNESEARSLLGSPEADLDPVTAATRLRALGARNVIIKLGARGSLLLADGGDPVFVAAHGVTAVDTTAAGDCFNGVFAAALSGGASPPDAARFASAASALAVTRPGASEAMPYRAEIERLASLAAPLAANP